MINPFALVYTLKNRFYKLISENVLGRCKIKVIINKKTKVMTINITYVKPVICNEIIIINEESK